MKMKSGTWIILLVVAVACCSFYLPGKTVAKLLLNARARLAEGAIWHPLEQKLYWVDIEGKYLHIYDPVTKKDRKLFTGERIGTVVPVKTGGALVALQNGIHKIDTKTGRMSLIADPVADPAIRFNDGKCDPSGRFWVGTMALDQQKEAAVLYRLDADKTVHLMLNSVTISNGIVWSKDKKIMYYIDTPTGSVQAFDYDDQSGDISNRRVVINIPEEDGSPDGMTIDAAGKLWIALWGGGAVGRFDPLTGKMLQKITVPAPNTSSCAFGGKNLETLFITTAREGLTPEQLAKFPNSGGIFSVRPGVKGVATNFFRGKL